MGVFSKECRSFVKELARRIRLQNNDSTAYLFLCQRSVIIQRYNSVCVLGSCA
jgi:RNase P subunit RPR2